MLCCHRRLSCSAVSGNDAPSTAFLTASVHQECQSTSIHIELTSKAVVRTSLECLGGGSAYAIPYLKSLPLDYMRTAK